MCKYLYLLLFLVTFNFSYAQNNDTTTISKAITKAQKENKHVFVNYLAASCKTSDKLKKQMESKIFKSNYVIVNIEVPQEETSEYVNCSNPFKSFGEEDCNEIKFPFWCIINNTGNYVKTSFENTNKNIGYPSTKEDVDVFIDIIRNTSKLSEKKLETIASNFHNENHQQLYSNTK